MSKWYWGGRCERLQSHIMYICTLLSVIQYFPRFPNGELGNPYVAGAVKVYPSHCSTNNLLCISSGYSAASQPWSPFCPMDLCGIAEKNLMFWAPQAQQSEACSLWEDMEVRHLSPLSDYFVLSWDLCFIFEFVCVGRHACVEAVWPIW